MHSIVAVTLLRATVCGPATGSATRTDSPFDWASRQNHSSAIRLAVCAVAANVCTAAVAIEWEVHTRAVLAFVALLPCGWLHGVDRSHSAQPQPLTRRLSLLPLSCRPTPLAHSSQLDPAHPYPPTHIPHTTAVDMSQLSTGEWQCRCRPPPPPPADSAAALFPSLRAFRRMQLLIRTALPCSLLPFCLRAGCIRRVHTSSTQEQLTDGAVVQVLEVKKIEPKAGQSGDRYRLVISDGEHYIQVSG